MNNSITQSDCHTSDSVFTVLFQRLCFAVFWHKHFQHAKISQWSHKNINNFVVFKDY